MVVAAVVDVVDVARVHTRTALYAQVVAACRRQRVDY